MIFSFSAKTGNESGKESLFVGKTVGQLVVADFEDWDGIKQERFAKSIEFPIRKGAHMTEYAILGILVFCSVNLQKYGLKCAALFSWVLAVLYAVSDEVHQLFVPDRSGQLRDVLIDAAGAAIGVLVVYAVKRKRAKL